MPNWCSNAVTLRHEDADQIERARVSFCSGTFFNEFVPCPEQLKETVAGSFSDNEKQAELALQVQNNQKRFGYSNWYDFCVNEWGTKWDVGDQQGVVSVEPHEIELVFDSAWAPPISFYQHMEQQGWQVHAMYHEPGMGFAGIWRDGVDDYFELSGFDSVTAAQYLPAELDEYFLISEGMAEWEAEERESESDVVTDWYNEGVEEVGLTPHDPAEVERLRHGKK